MEPVGKIILNFTSPTQYFKIAAIITKASSHCSLFHTGQPPISDTSPTAAASPETHQTRACNWKPLLTLLVARCSCWSQRALRACSAHAATAGRAARAAAHAGRALLAQQRVLLAVAEISVLHCLRSFSSDDASAPRSRSATTTPVRSRSVTTTLVRSRTVSNDLPGYDSDAYEPNMLAIGPYHRGKSRLNAIEDGKVMPQGMSGNATMRALGERARTRPGLRRDLLLIPFFVLHEFFAMIVTPNDREDFHGMIYAFFESALPGPSYAHNSQYYPIEIKHLVEFMRLNWKPSPSRLKNNNSNVTERKYREVIRCARA
ncbi:hypothetical protein WN943_029488 [Citrus x changshan-huyou]